MISLIVGCMNRGNVLKKTLPSWLDIPEIDDVIVVDWGSKIPLAEDPWFNQYLIKNKKIKIIRVENQKYYYRCLANNLARKFTDDANKLLLKIDTDYLNLDFSWINNIPFFIENEYFKDKKIKGLEMKNIFVVGSNLFCCHSNGFLFINKKDFDKVNGYNENLLPIWGVEDCDLYQRLEKDNFYEMEDYENRFFKKLYDEKREKLQKIVFFTIDKYIKHIPHPREQVFKNSKKDILEKYNLLNIKNFKNYTDTTQASLIQTKIAMDKKEWKQIEYKILKISHSNKYYILEPINTLPLEID